jgi:hypothetical protein
VWIVVCLALWRKLLIAPTRPAAIRYLTEVSLEIWAQRRARRNSARAWAFNQTSTSGLLGPLPGTGTLHNAVLIFSGPEPLLGAVAFGPARAPVEFSPYCDDGTEPASAGTRASRRACRRLGEARRGQAQGACQRPEDRRDLKRAPGRWACVVVLSDDRRCRRGRAAVAHLVLPGLRAIRLGRPAHSRPSSGRRDLKLDPVAFVSEVFAQRAVREARNVDRRAAVGP